MPESTLKGILKNLVDKQWVERRLLFSDPNGYPELRTDLPQKITIKRIKGKEKEIWVPRGFISKFKRELMSLKYSKKNEGV